MTGTDSTYASAKQASITTRPGHGVLVFRRAGHRTAICAAAASSPLRLLMPRNHGSAAWVFLANLGGGLVDGDNLELKIEAEPETTALVGTQASTKVYRSPRGCSQRLEIRVGDGAAIAIMPDPVVCFAGANYEQEVAVSLATTASLFLADGYTAGRAARGERWQFARFESRTTISRGGLTILTDATKLDPAHGAVAERMGRFDALLSIIAIGPRFAAVREAMLAPLPRPMRSDDALVAASPVGADSAILRVMASRFENASRALRQSFAALAEALGDDPFARKW